MEATPLFARSPLFCAASIHEILASSRSISAVSASIGPRLIGPVFPLAALFERTFGLGRLFDRVLEGGKVWDAVGMLCWSLERVWAVSANLPSLASCSGEASGIGREFMYGVLSSYKRPLRIGASPISAAQRAVRLNELVSD